MGELNKLKILKPTLLYKHDLFEIEHLLKKHLTCRSCNFDITPMNHGKKLTETPFHSMTELFNSRDLPARVSQITIEAKELSDNKELLRDAKVSIGKFSAHVRVIGKDNNTWVENTFSDLSKFMDSKRAWYWLAARTIPPIFNSSMVITFILTMTALLTGTPTALVFPIILATSAITMLTLNLSGKVYSFTRVNLFNEQEERRKNHEKYVIWLYFTIVACCITGTVTTTWNVIAGG